MSHERYMRLALELGRRGLGRTWPNPAVGCVIVKDGVIVGRGHTQVGGRPHAEPMALAQAGERASGATAYVTLEPCSHFGQTPPCAQALIDAGVARVVSPFADQDPRVNGRGFAMLRDAGIDVVTGVLEAEAREDHRGFFLKVTENRPFVTLKLANSFDGRIATASGDSQWITGSEARRLVHLMRAQHDAVLVGGGTARADDPSLTVRDLGITRQPVRVVASQKLSLPKRSKLAHLAGEVPTWLCHGDQVEPDVREFWTNTGARLIECEVVHGRIDPMSMLNALAEQGITRVFCEGGGSLAAALLNAGLVDELVGFSAGLAIGAEGMPSIGALGLAKLSEAPRFELTDTRQIGGDILHIWRPRKG